MLRVRRWRCVAVHDVAECLGRPVRIRYLPGEKKVVLTGILRPKYSKEGLALVQEAHDKSSATQLYVSATPSQSQSQSK